MSFATQRLKETSAIALFLKFIINSILFESFLALAEEPSSASVPFLSLVPCARTANASLEDTRLSFAL